MDTWKEIQSDWKRVKGEVHEHWDLLTDEDLDVIAGKRDRLVGMLEDKYGLEREAAEQQIDAFCSARSGGAGCGELAGFEPTGKATGPPG